MRPRNQLEKLWLGAAALGALGIVAIGWFFLIAPQRTETADLQARTTDAQLQNLTLQQRITDLGSQKAHWKAFIVQLGQARQALPTTSAMAPFLRSVQSIGATSNARVTSLSVGEATAVTPAAPVGPAGSTPSPAPTAAGASTGSSASSSGLFTIPITASVTGPRSALTTFLTRLQAAQPRAVLVTDVTMGAATSGGGVTLQLSMSAFVAPAGVPAGATPGR